MFHSPVDTWPGRGGHQMLVVHESGVPYLWVIGGRGGNNEIEGGPDVSHFVCLILIFVISIPRTIYILLRLLASDLLFKQ